MSRLSSLSYIRSSVRRIQHCKAVCYAVRLSVCLSAAVMLHTLPVCSRIRVMNIIESTGSELATCGDCHDGGFSGGFVSTAAAAGRSPPTSSCAETGKTPVLTDPMLYDQSHQRYDLLAARRLLACAARLDFRSRAFSRRLMPLD